MDLNLPGSRRWRHLDAVVMITRESTRLASEVPRRRRCLAGDLLEPKKVKRAYYKASRFVHPDKLVGLSVEQRFVGKRIFDALSQAYAEFEESGMG